MPDSPYSSHFEEFYRDHVSPSGNWSFGKSSPHTHKIGRGLQTLRMSGLGFVLALSPLTSGSDPWWAEHRGRGTLSIESVFNPVAKRRISILDARRIAFEILLQAERERIWTADDEARRSLEVWL